MSDIVKELKETALLVEGEMKKILNRRSCDRLGYERLKESIEYSVFAGGKRIRPYLCVLFCNAFGGSTEKALPYAAAVEFMHTASLIHDDLPAMDNDDLRRGKPSNHKQFDEYTAILAGDALMIESFGAITGNTLCTPEQNAAAVSVLADCAGMDGMCGGQELDLYTEKHAVQLETVEKTHLLKTAAMIKAAVNLGCIAAGATAEQRSNAVAMAEEIGLAFQIIDDILDATAEGDKLGKTVGKDAASEKNTYVTKAGMEKARLKAECLTKSAISRAERVGGKQGETLKALCEYLLCREY